ncbi:unnamed protein product [Dibothriocephalus latus]|uniref:Uncharacterized protein n=1 Tax=Dibothriocephalus latus TaxID=60516 RepID=A0A3P7RQ46_DIBLA|nr:unnamed protein product [Dibothriocephalus latus]
MPSNRRNILSVRGYGGSLILHRYIFVASNFSNPGIFSTFRQPFLHFYHETKRFCYTTDFLATECGALD